MGYGTSHQNRMENLFTFMVYFYQHGTLKLACRGCAAAINSFRVHQNCMLQPSGKSTMTLLILVTSPSPYHVRVRTVLILHSQPSVNIR
jgi:hypothetical protein